MRQRRLKNLDEKLEALSPCLVPDGEALKGHWRSAFVPRMGEEPEGLYLEVGCGKGRFITGQGQADPRSGFIGIEGQSSVVVACGKRILEEEHPNVLLLYAYMHDLGDWFAPGELDGVYLNFSDPWPKARHAKRRLTCGANLEMYRRALRPGGFVAFKTDNDGLFDFTLEEVERMGYTVVALTRDLHHSPYQEGNIQTEYEERFASQGKNINYIKLQF